MPDLRLPSAFVVKQQIATTRALIKTTRAFLDAYPTPDLFVGRKTQEPFPVSDDLLELGIGN